MYVCMYVGYYRHTVARCCCMPTNTREEKTGLSSKYCQLTQMDTHMELQARTPIVPTPKRRTDGQTDRRTDNYATSNLNRVRHFKTANVNVLKMAI
jgi:hypothetical protein